VPERVESKILQGSLDLEVTFDVMEVCSRKYLKFMSSVMTRTPLPRERNETLTKVSESKRFQNWSCELSCATAG
jgi:hypothetical protein